MLAMILMLVLAINGGLFAGTILYTAYNSAQMDELRSLTHKMWDVPMFF
ncbi:MAG: hypothetical protein H6868_04405 [Rhodospirillales bacterium]|nr:hypothetical protein [Rhodospirillales bacterium]